EAPIDWPDREEATRAVAEYLNALDRDAPDERKAGKRKKPPKAVSLTDPQAAWVAKRKMRPIFGYDANYLIDNKLGVIIGAEGTRANSVEENRVALSMIERVMARFDLKPKRLAADTAYGTGQTLKSLMDCGIEPHIPVWDKSKRKDGTFSRAGFQYDTQRDLYTCPAGKILKTTGKVLSDNSFRYLASTRDCGPYPLKEGCCPNTPQRKIPRDINESVRDHVRALAETKAFDRSRRERKKVEMAFAHLKRILKLDRLRLRGLAGARDEVLLAATAQNLRTLARYVGRSPPIPTTA
ncbi:MAG: transposase, partial [Pseudomonadota bacterium]